MTLPRITVGLLLGIILADASAPARRQDPPLENTGTESASAGGPNQVNQIYSHTTPYMDDPPAQLKSNVPALHGLETDDRQVTLQSILSRTGETIEGQVPKMPDLTARESVSQAQFTGRGATPLSPQGGNGIMGPGRGSAQIGTLLQQYSLQSTMDEKQLEESLHTSLVTAAPWQDFDYLMLVRQSPGGSPTLEESRTGLNAPNGRKSKREQKILHGIGFGYLWLLFLPENTPQSNYRLLGRQKMYGHETYVVGFAQSPDRVKVPGEITLPGIAYPLLYQGIAWIDAETFRIVRLRTDLLAPIPAIQVERLTSDLQFSEVKIPELNLPLWLPKQVELIWKQGEQLSGELHLYANYRLFHATVRALPPG